MKFQIPERGKVCQPSPIPLMDWSKFFSNIAKVKLRGGMAGKVCTVLIVISIVAGMIAVKSGSHDIQILALILIFGLGGMILWRLMNFVDKNPPALILDGAEFVAHTKIEHASKGHRVIDVEGQPVPSAQAANLPSTETAMLPDSSASGPNLEGEDQ